MRATSGRIIAGEIVAIVVVGAGVVWAATTAEDPGLVFGGIATVAAVVALALAWGAFRTSWPQYSRWRDDQAKAPAVRVQLQVAQSRQTVPDPVGQRVLVNQRSFVLRVLLINNGDGPMTLTTLNVVAPTTCQLDPIDPPVKEHYLSPLPSASDQLEPGNVHIVRWTVARPHLTPGHHVFHVEVSMPIGVGPWPLMVELQGNPSPADEQRFTRLVVSLDERRSHFLTHGENPVGTANPTAG
jgi:hypothetical protein